jgi:hypothetical protein
MHLPSYHKHALSSYQKATLFFAFIPELIPAQPQKVLLFLPAISYRPSSLLFLPAISYRPSSPIPVSFTHTPQIMAA